MTSAEQTAAAINRMMEAGAAARADSVSARLTRLVEERGDSLGAATRADLEAMRGAAALAEAASEAHARAILTLAAYVLPDE